MAEQRGEALAIRRETAYGLSLQSPPPLTKERFEMLAAMANQLSKARGLIPAIFTEGPDGPAKVLAVLLMAHELQLPFMESLNGMQPIEGKVSMSGDMRLALIRGAGHTVRFKEYSDERVSIYFRRRDTGEDGLFSWSIADAQRARDVRSGKPLADKPAWQSYPRSMLLWRVVTEASHALFTDLMHGRIFPSPDQLADAIDPDSGGIAAADLDAAELKEVMPNAGPDADRARSQPADMSAGAAAPAVPHNGPDVKPHDRPDAARAGARPGVKGSPGLEPGAGPGRSEPLPAAGPGGPARDRGLAERADPPAPSGAAPGASPLPAPPIHLQARVRFYAMILKRRQHQDKGELLPDPDVLQREAEASLNKLAGGEHLSLSEPKDLKDLAELLERMGREAGLDLAEQWQKAPA